MSLWPLRYFLLCWRTVDNWFRLFLGTAATWMNVHDFACSESIFTATSHFKGLKCVACSSITTMSYLIDFVNVHNRHALATGVVEKLYIWKAVWKYRAHCTYYVWIFSFSHDIYIYKVVALTTVKMFVLS
jgi:hypothetical protein